MSDYEALVKELTDLSEPFSYSPTLGSRAAAAVEALVAENESWLTVLAVTQARAIATVAAERDSALKALGESRARFGSLEASVVELGEAILKDSHCSHLGHDVLALVKHADDIYAEATDSPTCAVCGKPSTYRLGMPEPSWCDDHGPQAGDTR